MNARCIGGAAATIWYSTFAGHFCAMTRRTELEKGSFFGMDEGLCM